MQRDNRRFIERLVSEIGYTSSQVERESLVSRCMDKAHIHAAITAAMLRWFKQVRCADAPTTAELNATAL